VLPRVSAEFAHAAARFHLRAVVARGGSGQLSRLRRSRLLAALSAAPFSAFA